MSSDLWGRLDRLDDRSSEVLARHEDGEGLPEYECNLDGFLRFVDEQFAVELWEKQVEIARSYFENRQTAVPGANATGKGTVAYLLSLFHYLQGGLVLVTGSAERMTGDVFMDRGIRPLFQKAPKIPGKLYSMELRPPVADGSGIKAMTSTTASKMGGFHHDKDILVIYEEAQDVPPFAWNAMEGCAGGVDDRFLAIGNPLHNSGRFAQVCRSPNWNTIHVSALDHPNLVEGRVVIPGGPEPEVIRERRQERGDDDPFVQARIFGQFPDQDIHGVNNPEDIDRAVENHQAGRFHWDAYGRTSEDAPPPILAVDVARFGDDQSMVAVRRGPRLDRFVSWGKCDTVETVRRVAEVAKDVGVKRRIPGIQGSYGRIIVDAVGMPGVFDQLKDVGWPAVAYKGSKRAYQRARYHNRRTEAFFTLRERLEKGEISLPADAELREELLALRWQADGKSRAQLEPKSDLKTALGRSPDRADACAMAFYPWAKTRGGGTALLAGI